MCSILQFARMCGFNYPQRACTAVYWVRHSPFLPYYIILLVPTQNTVRFVCKQFWGVHILHFFQILLFHIQASSHALLASVMNLKIHPRNLWKVSTSKIIGHSMILVGIKLIGSWAADCHNCNIVSYKFYSYRWILNFGGHDSRHSRPSASNLVTWAIESTQIKAAGLTLNE